MAEPLEGVTGELAEVVRGFRSHPGLLGKARIAMVTDVLGPTDWDRGPGDDTAVLPGDDCHALVAGEAMWPPFVERDPYAAGIAAVVANVNDIAAMGGRPEALVDTIVADEPSARSALDGLRFGAELYRVPVVGGHLTIRPGPPALSAFILGAARRPLRALQATAGQALLFCACLEGRMREDFPFFSSIRERGPALADDVRLLADLAEAGRCLAAKDVSMAGVLGSLAMLLEPTRCGVMVELERLPRPPGVPLAAWAGAFPSFAFLLCTPPSEVAACRDAFTARGLACEQIGRLDASGAVRAGLGRQEGLLIDLRREPVTGLRGPAGQAAWR
ncbi:MAG TPA: AIR synthase related protein [Actinomycetes bacterium]|nr:AIR synthase related protein [Actinomycetes bacterium]